MDKIAEKLTDYILSKGEITEKEYAVYRYGFQSGLEQTLCILFSLCIAYTLNMIWTCIIFMAVFFLQRSYIKGIHLNSYTGCFALSVSTIFLGLILCQTVCISDEAALITTVCLLMTVFAFSELFPADDDISAMKYYHNQKRLITLFTVLLALFLFEIHCNKGLFIILYAECVMLLSTVFQLYREKNEKAE